MRALQRLQVPALIFVNKIDRRGAGYGRLLADISERLAPAVAAMGSVSGIGTRDCTFQPYAAADAAHSARLAEVLAERNEEILAAYVDAGPWISPRRLRGELAAQTRRGNVHPVYFGSALTGAGVDSLMTGIAELLPAAERDGGGPVSGRVFKIERGAAGEKIAYVRMFSGTVCTRDRVRFGRRSARKVTAISVFADGQAAQRDCMSAGEIGKLWGLAEIQVGDAVGTARQPEGRQREGRQREGEHQFAPPTLETVVVPRTSGENGALRVALAQLAEQDPLINVRQDDVRQEISVSLYGEVQKEVIEATLATDFGLAVGFRETTTICIERLAGTGAAVERLRKPPNPFLATIGLRLEPAVAGAGVKFDIAAELGSMPVAFFRAVEDTVRETLQQGLHGWEITDCLVTMTHSGYLGKHSLGHQRFSKSLSSTGEDYRKLTPLVVMAALQQAKTVVCEPIYHFRLDVPAGTLAQVLPALARLRAVPHSQVAGDVSATLEGDIPAAQVHQLRQQLPPLTRGEGVLECAFDRYQPVRGVPPGPAADRQQPAQPGGVPAARHPPGESDGELRPAVHPAIVVTSACRGKTFSSRTRWTSGSASRQPSASTVSR